MSGRDAAQPDPLEHARRYWQYEYDVVRRYLVPLLTAWGAPVERASVIDVGCGEGGGVCGLQDAGARCEAFDIDGHRIAMANTLKGDRAVAFTTGDIYAPDTPFLDRQFDLVVLHDVFEHLEHKDEMLRKLMRYMKRSGRMLITFPPYYSAFGAHQQLLRFPLARAPFVHLVPFFLSRVLPRMKNEDAYFAEEVRKLGRLKMGLRKFLAVVRQNGLRVTHSRAYLIGPNHIRFGLRPVPAGPLARIPLLNEVLCSGIVYLLAATGEQDGRRASL